MQIAFIQWANAPAHFLTPGESVFSKLERRSFRFGRQSLNPLHLAIWHREDFHSLSLLACFVELKGNLMASHHQDRREVGIEVEYGSSLEDDTAKCQPGHKQWGDPLW